MSVEFEPTVSGTEPETHRLWRTMTLRVQVCRLSGGGLVEDRWGYRIVDSRGIIYDQENFAGYQTRDLAIEAGSSWLLRGSDGMNNVWEDIV